MAVGLGPAPSRAPTVRWTCAQPEGALLVDDEGRATASALSFGRTGWLGGLTVAPEHRGRGLGEAITEAAAAWLVERGAETVLLYATDLGEPLYARLGFTVTGSLALYAAPPAQVVGEVVPWQEAAELDALATGEDRSVVLRAGVARRTPAGVGVTLPWGRAHGIGDPALAHCSDGQWILPSDAEAPAGWTERARVTRMERGAQVAWRPELVRGAFNLFWG